MIRGEAIFFAVMRFNYSESRLEKHASRSDDVFVGIFW